MPRPAKKVSKALITKGFRESAGRDHHFYFLYINGKKTIIKTKISRGSHKDISDQILNKMQKQLHLPYREFNAYLDCTFSEQDYKSFLINEGLIDIEKEMIH